MILAAKCQPKIDILKDVYNAGIEAVELYLTGLLLEDIPFIKNICQKFSLRYALHAPTNGCAVEKLAEFAEAIKAEVVVFHNIYWDDEWDGIVKLFKGLSIQLCIENVYSTLEPIKLMRRYHMGCCLDIEHMQLACSGVYKEAFLRIMREASHVHLTGYKFGSNLWHTPIHHSPEHNSLILGLLNKAEYGGFVVSEAEPSFQTFDEFKKLKIYFDEWKEHNKDLSGISA